MSMVTNAPPEPKWLDFWVICDEQKAHLFYTSLDGRLWRFSLGLTGSNVATITSGPTKLFDAGNAQPLYSSMAVVNVGGTQQYIFFGSGSDLLSSAGVSQSYKLVGVLDQNGSGLEKFALSLQAVNGADGSGEKVSAFPAVAGDIVFFTPTTYKPVALGQAPDANVYALTFIGGPAYDNTGDNKNITVVSGSSAATNEMCMAVGYTFPATTAKFCVYDTSIPTTDHCYCN